MNYMVTYPQKKYIGW